MAGNTMDKLQFLSFIVNNWDRFGNSFHGDDINDIWFGVAVASFVA